MKFPEGHPLGNLTPESGFKMKESPKLISVDTGAPLDIDARPPTMDEIFARIDSSILGPDDAPPGFMSLRTAIPNTEGRALGWKLKEHVLSAKARHWPQIQPFEYKGQSVAICGGGPSLSYTLPAIRALQKKGVKIIAINRTHDFLVNLPKTHGQPWIKPWAGIILEAVPQASQYMTPTTGVRYYVGSQCAPETFDRFTNHDHVIWHAKSKPELEECLTLREKLMMVPSIGSTCGLRAILLMYMLGFSNIHVFGLDSCYNEYEIKNGIMGADGMPKLHAYTKPEAAHDMRELLIDGFPEGKRTYWGNSNMVAQASEFQEMLKWRDELLRRGCMEPHNLIIHGFGAIPDIARALYAPPAPQQAERKIA